MTTTIWSTTKTQPITFDRISPTEVQITDERGATQIYAVADLQRVLDNEAY